MSSAEKTGVRLPDEGGQAFPRSTTAATGDWSEIDPGSEGLTARQWFAGQALIGLATAVYNDGPTPYMSPAEMAFAAYAIADAFIAHEREEVKAWRANRDKIQPPESSPED